MKYTMNSVSDILFQCWAWLLFALPMPFILVFHVLVSLIPQKKRLVYIYRAHRVWIGLWEFGTGIQFSVHNHEIVEKDQTYVFVVNHCNLMDIPIVGSSIIHPWKSLIKKEILSIPFLGWLIGRISISVDRTNRVSREQSMQGMVAALKEGISILIFPEGTRNRTPNPLKDFHTGAFRAAIAGNVPIIPVILTDTRKLQPVDSLRFYPGRGHMTFLPPISTEGFTKATVPLLKDKVWEEMNAAIIERDPDFANYASSKKQKT